MPYAMTPFWLIHLKQKVREERWKTPDEIVTAIPTILHFIVRVEPHADVDSSA